ncbi:hypothetical protein AXG93_4497s1000 [Marchantia polymorpha subsp. ruderalis]|uniref:Uncharacterized protein n=1 Tax=Marchantia polymorpha subsp. ruderalis TaxID=1480154 RepID=A0A176VS00_MARPO|nr:hypothetical protein AXG93_4497s1000 [Marchantia polymorpha subsp. ruderalis]
MIGAGPREGDEKMELDDERPRSLIEKRRPETQKAPSSCGRPLLMRRRYSRLEAAVADLESGRLQRRRWRLRIRPRVRIIFTTLSSVLQRIKKGYMQIMLSFASKAQDSKLLPSLAHKKKRGAPALGHKPKARTFNHNDLEQKYLDYIKRWFLIGAVRSGDMMTRLVERIRVHAALALAMVTVGWADASSSWILFFLSSPPKPITVLNLFYFIPRTAVMPAALRADRHALSREQIPLDFQRPVASLRIWMQTCYCHGWRDERILLNSRVMVTILSHGLEAEADGGYIPYRFQLNEDVTPDENLREE